MKIRWPFKSKGNPIPELPHPGSFGAIRKYDIHTGVDIYAAPKTAVFMIEPGVIVGAGQFTGEAVNSPWWYDTYYILVESETRVLLYGELEKNRIQELSNYVGWKMNGVCLGFVEPVLDQKGHLFFSMLHLEEYDIGYRGNGVIWNLGEEKPKGLKDPTEWLKEI